MQHPALSDFRLARHRRHSARAIAGTFSLAALALAIPAQATDISDVPLITSPNVQAKPNLMFVLDDSGSMDRAYMPDDMGGTGKYGFYSAQCNGVAYDPSLQYLPPVNADGTSMANASFTAAWSDGFAQTGSNNLDILGGTEDVGSITTSSSVSSGTGSKTFQFSTSGYSTSSFSKGQTITLTSEQLWGTDLVMTGTVSSWAVSGNDKTLIVNVTSKSGSSSSSSWDITRATPSFYYVYNKNGSEPKMGWTYQASGNNVGKVDTTTTFYKQCTSNLGSSPGSGVFDKVTVSSTSTEAQNYANWYAYYRKRTFLMRTAVGRAFAALDGGYRVGFSTINSSTSVATSDGFQPVKEFTGTQRSTLYTKLYSADADGSTPLRGALSKIGRYYAGKFTSTQDDPVQYACQRNFVLLSTDGYWNKGSGDATENTSTYGPLDISGNTVGNQDGTEVRPMLDSTKSFTTYTKTNYSVSSTRYGSSSCNSSSNNGNYYKVTTQAWTSTNNTDWSKSGNSSTSCYAGGSIVVNNQSAASLTGQSVDSATTSTPSTSGGSSNTLADVAEYYYNTDLRTTSGVCSSGSSGTTQNVCGALVPTSGRDTAKYVHMTTFAIGLGVNGTLAYDRNYLTQLSGDYAKLVSGDINWPDPSTSITNSSGDARNIDDLWHAAVNGRGQYYSALNASQLADAISGVVSAIQEVTGSSAAATTSTLELVAGDNNQVYAASYTTGSWIGDLKAFSLNGSDGTISSTPAWSAQTKLTAATYSSRKIYYRQPTTNALRTFDWTNLTADGYGSNFSGLCSTHTGVTQCNNVLSTAEQTAANSGERLVNYLRGDRTYESASTAVSPATSQALYRARKGVLGDIINGAPKYVSKPNFGYSDAGYTDFVQAQKNRKPMVYVAANDGMLHAFSADTTDGGTELWAYVPTAVMQNLYLLADSNYAEEHRYFVDGAPVVGDIYVNGAWKTILVGGLGNGGRSYYALDITNPSSPVPLWEFSDNNLGLTFGNPVITKRANGEWVVIFGSGYNNVSPGDGAGRLFVLNANAGTRSHEDIVTTAGSTTTPSGLTKINGWIDQDSDNTTRRIYGGDTLGNLWRFDIDGLVQPYNAALLLAKFQVNSTTPQPITTRPRLTQIANQTVIIVGTGRYLGTTDINDKTTQSIYAVKDALTNSGLGDVRNNSTLVHQTFTVNGDTATISALPVNWASGNGWWVDLPHSGERVSTDITLQGGMLAIATAIPNGDACSSGGSSWAYTLGSANGWALDNVAGNLVSENSLIVGQSLIQLAPCTDCSTPSPAQRRRLLRTMSDGTIRLVDTQNSSSSNVTPQRTSWRELVN